MTLNRSTYMVFVLCGREFQDGMQCSDQLSTVALNHKYLVDPKRAVQTATYLDSSDLLKMYTAHKCPRSSIQSREDCVIRLQHLVVDL